MGYSPWGHKDLDMTEVTACSHAPKTKFKLKESFEIRKYFRTNCLAIHFVEILPKGIVTKVPKSLYLIVFNESFHV